MQEKASDRPLYDALLRRLGDGDRLVVWKVDRLGRSTLDALTIVKKRDDRGVPIVITTLGIDLNTLAGRLFGMMSQISEFERELPWGIAHGHCAAARHQHGSTLYLAACPEGGAA